MASPAKMGVLVRGLVDCDARPCRAPEYGPQPDRLTAQLRHCSRNKLQGFTQASLPSGPHRGAPDRQKAAVLVVRPPPIEQSIREFRELLTTNGCHFKSYRGGNILTVSRGKQFERFVQTARKLGVNESMEDFTVKFRKIVPPKRPKQSQD